MFFIPGARAIVDDYAFLVPFVAEATFKKGARINIRLSSRDLRAIQSRALKEGIPYQTLVSSVLHKYVDGRLKKMATMRSSTFRQQFGSTGRSSAAPVNSDVLRHGNEANLNDQR